MRRFDKGCCCIELRTACLLIAYYNVVHHMLRTALAVTGLIYGRVVTYNGREYATTQHAVSLFIHLSLVIFTIILLIGLHQHRRSHVKAYLIYLVVFIAIYSLGFLSIVMKPSVEMGPVVWNLINILTTILFLLVIRSYYQKMEDKRPRTTSTSVYNVL